METNNGTKIWRWIVGVLGSVLLIVFTTFSGWVLDKISEHDNFALAEECDDNKKQLTKDIKDSRKEQQESIQRLHDNLSEQLKVIQEHILEIYKDMPKKDNN